MKIAEITTREYKHIYGFWNQKIYSGNIYINVSKTGLFEDINWKDSIKIKRSNVRSLKWIEGKRNFTEKKELKKNRWCYLEY